MELFWEFIKGIIASIMECLPLGATVMGLALAFAIAMIIMSEPWKYRSMKAWIKAVFKD